MKEEDGPWDLGPNQPFRGTKPWVRGSAVLCSPLPLQKENLTADLKGSFPPGDTGPEEHIFLPLLGFVLKKYELLSEDDSWTDFSTEIYKPLL